MWSNKRLVSYFDDHVEHGIHTLECMFHVNEIYFSHVVTSVDGKTKGPSSMQDGAMLNTIKLNYKTKRQEHAF